MNGEEINLLNQYLEFAEIKPDFHQKLKTYLEYLLEQNTQLNLVSRKLDTATIIKEHIYDCLCGWKYFRDCSSITDIGTGGGLPGLLFAIIFPGKRITLVDKSAKKIDFLKSAVTVLGLENVVVKSGLLDSLTIDSEVITCRGFKPVLQIISMTDAFFKKGGSYILFKGRSEKISEELRDAGKKFKFNSTIESIAGKLDKERHILKIQRKDKK